MLTGCAQGVHRVMHRVIHMFRWFLRKKRAVQAPNLAALEAAVAALAEEQAKVRSEWKEVQGRLYAVLQRRGVNLKQETTEDEPEATTKARTLPANASKAQVKAALGLNTPAGVAHFLRGVR